MPHSSPATVLSQAEQTTLACSHAQQRLWFLDQMEPGSPLYNIPVRLRLKGRLDRETLEKSLREIISRHEVLRTTFNFIDGQPVQVIHDSFAWNLDYLDLEQPDAAERQTLALRERQREAGTGFNLVTGPLLRALLMKLG